MSVMKFPIKSLGSDPILTAEDDIISLYEINDVLTSNSIEDQIRLCQRLGILIENDSIRIHVKERARAYEMPDEDRTIISENETLYEFEVKLSVSNCKERFPLPLSINFNKCTNQIYVNFFGEIVFKNRQDVEVSVPLIGRGTAALEGRDNDAHAEPCIDGCCASFQQKVAVLVSILYCFQLTRDDIEIFRAHLLKNCEKFYGRNDILNYTCDKAFSLTTLSYYDYLKNIYENENDENVPIMLQHFIEFCEPHPSYFNCLREKLTSEELTKEMKDTSGDPKGPDKNTISTSVRLIINKFIHLDEIYMIKPYPGEDFKVDDGQPLSICELAQDLNSGSIEMIKSGLRKLGFSISNGEVRVIISDKPSKKNLDSKEHLEEKLDLIANFSNNEDALLNVRVILDISPIDNVNFFGKIEIKNGLFQKTVIPLLGRGTIALDGKLNEKHAGFCVSSKMATFQQKVAIIYCYLFVLNANPSDLRTFENYVKRINNSYYGLQDIIDYTFKVIRQEEKKTFFEYMKATHMRFSKMPIMLKNILTYNRLPSKYYEGLISKFTEEELLEEEQRLETIRLSNLIPKFLRKFNYFLGKINIF